MNSLIKGLVIILIIGGSSAGVFNPISSDKQKMVEKTEELPSKVSSFVDEASNEVSDFQNSLNQGYPGDRDVIEGIPNSEGVASILSLVSGILPKDGQLYLESAIQEIISGNFDLHDILSLLNDAVQYFFNLVMTTINKVNITEYLNALLAARTTEDGELDFKGLAEKYIKTAEEYHVITEDGCILTLFRIPGDGDAVLLCHGIFSSSDDFIILGKSSLVYMLVQKGYDVWVMNFRGNRYSRNHEEFNPDIDDEFWDYSMHEFGYYDLKAVIDTVLEETEKEQLSVIGHSEGNAAVFVLTSTRPEYNERIKVVVALSPVCYLSNPGFALHILVSLGPILDEVLQTIGVEEILGFESFTRNLIQRVCSQGALGYNACVNLGLGTLYGYHPENLEPDRFLSVLGHFPAGSSRKNLNHHLQIWESGNFAQFDYGDNNKDKYGSESPPEYNFRKVTCKVVLFAGGKDNTLEIEDAERVRDQVPNLGLYYVLEKYNHADFIWGEDAAEVLYPKVLAQLKTFTNPIRPSVDIPHDDRHRWLGGSF